MNRAFNTLSEPDQIAFALVVHDLASTALPEDFMPDATPCQWLEAFRAVNIKVGSNLSKIRSGLIRAAAYLDDLSTPHRCPDCHFFILSQ
jgi:hypothetical protein